MSFEVIEENNNSSSFTQRPKYTKTNFEYLIRWGIVKDEKQAQNFLIGLLVLIIIVTIVILQFDNLRKIKPRGNVPTINYGNKR